MTIFNRGDVILVSFIFTDESGTKQRPAVVVSSDEYHRDRKEAIVAAITSQINRQLVGDYLLVDWQSAGLLFPSVATGIIRTVKQELINRRLGSLSLPDMQIVDSKLRNILDLDK
jgi:mRNA interferase MazF